MITTADTMPIKYFDTLEYVKESEKRGLNSDLAEYQARQIESAIETAVQYVKHVQKDFVKKSDSQNLATKENIQNLDHRIGHLEHKVDNVGHKIDRDIAILRYDTLKFIVWTGIAITTSIIGSMFTLLKFHWF